MERMRSLRNKVYGHATSTRIPDNVFQGYWTTAVGICSRMDAHYGGSKYMDIMKDIEKSEFVQQKVSDYFDIVSHEFDDDEIRFERDLELTQIDLRKGNILLKFYLYHSW